MQGIRQWVIAIITVIIFVTFIEILLPSSQYKRYINVVIGFLVMVVILNPLTQAITRGIDLTEEIMASSNQLNQLTVKNTMENIQYSHKEAIIKIYRQEVEEQIKYHVENITDYKVNKIKVSIEEEENDEFGMVKHIDLALEEEEEPENKENKKSKIEPISINISLGAKMNNTVEAQSIMINNEGESIKKELSNFYNVPQENISIYILKSDK